tara:strand:- start:253 stop:468 length:216 start_codon:yes stop_codon:yes gene_type:complete
MSYEEIKNRCNYKNCNKKIKISDYPCKCKLIFCSLHRSPEQHECSYDFKNKDEKDKKIEEMKCVKNKIDSI